LKRALVAYDLTGGSGDYSKPRGPEFWNRKKRAVSHHRFTWPTL
jgi:hypothetical protein